MHEKGGFLSRRGRAEAEPSPDTAVEADGVGVDETRPDRRGRQARPTGPTLVVDFEPEEETQLPQDQPLGEPQPLTPPDGNNNGRIGLDELDQLDRQDVIEQNRTRKRVQSLEKDMGRTFSPEEREIITNHYLGRETLSAIDDSTQKLFDLYKEKLEEPKTWIGKKIQKHKKTISKVLGVLASMGGSILTRSIFHSFELTSPIAGTLTGAIVGATAGGIRSYFAEKSKQFGPEGIIQEYTTLKDDPNVENSKKEAITFLHKVLESKTFQGNTGDLLKLLVFYKKEAGESIRAEEVEDFIADLWDEGPYQNDTHDPRNILVANFKESANEACYEAAKKGMWNGMWKGAVIGAVSDVIGGLIHHWRVEHFKDVYLREHAGYNNTLHPYYSPDVASASDIAPDVHFNALNNGQGLNLEATPYGNTLASAIKAGVQNGQLHVPDAYVTQMTQEINQITGLPYSIEEARNQFIYNFNFTQIPNVGDHWGHGGVILMNKDGVQELMNRAVEASSGHWNIDPTTNIKTWIPEIDYQKFAETLRTGGTFLETQYPADYGVLHSTSNALMDKATEEAQRLAAEPIAQGLAQGGAIGFMTNRATEAEANKSTGGAGDKDSGLRAQGSGGAAGATEEQQRAVRPAVVPPPRTAAEEPPVVAVVPEETPPPEPEPEPTGPIVWREKFESNRDTFEQTANNYLLLPSKGWAQMSDQEKNNFVGLFDFINEYNQDGLRFKIRFKQGSEVFKLVELPTIASPNVRIENDREAKTINFDSGALIGITFQTREPEDKTAPEQWRMRDVVNPTTGKLNYDFINLTFREARSLGNEAAIRIQRKWDVKGNELPLFAGDDLKKKAPEIIGFDAEAKKLRIINSDGEIGTINEADFKNIYGFNIYHWARGGTDDKYK